MDNQSFDDLGFHPEGGFTFDDLYTPSNDTTEEQYNIFCQPLEIIIKM